MAYDRVRFLVVQDFLEFKKKHYLPDTPPSQLKKDQDRRFYFHLLQGMVRHQRLLETEIQRRVNKPFHKLQGTVIGILTLGLYQLFFMDKIPVRASIYETVELATPFRLLPQKALINAVMRNLQRDLEKKYSYQVHPLPIRTSHQDWMVERWRQAYSNDDVQSICEANNTFEGITIRPVAPWNTQQLYQMLKEEKVLATPHPIVSQALIVENTSDLLISSVFIKGACYVQDASSQIFLELTQNLWKGFVLDVCAAPGGKAIQIQTAPHVTNLVVNDVSRKRLLQVCQNMQRLQRNPPVFVVSDGRFLPFAAKFDAILLDVPCSSSGTIRKNPHIKWIASESELLSQTTLQKQLLENAARFVKPEGVLVYATCSLEIEENEQQVQKFLEKNPDFIILPFATNTAILDSYRSFVTEKGCYKVIPSSSMMGFFAAVFLHKR
ncbi:MAG: hypothetical protein HQM14_02690 [SAR324 cluster bacterium]|nr:hypothetical protein [SAR324 cluster bacterium]